LKRLPVASAALAARALRDVRAADAPTGPILMCGRAGPLDPLREALLDAPQTDAAAVQLYAVRRLRPDDHEELARAAVVVYGGEVASALDDDTRSDLEVAGSAGRPLIAVLEGADVPEDAVVAAARVHGVRPGSLLLVKSGRFPLGRALRLLAAQAGPAGPGLAARLPALRPHVVSHLIDAAARRNGLVAAAVWVPVADMPVLTAVELRLVLQIAACYGEELDADRAVELLGVLGAGVGLRTIARELLDAVPIAGWIVKGGVAWTGTRALGVAADEYFRRGSPADLTSLRTAAERLRGA
jgi:uncharacterized protein (DUF697 family)